MFVVLDTNHFTELALGSRLGKRLSERIEARGADAFSWIVTNPIINRHLRPDTHHFQENPEGIQSYQPKVAEGCGALPWVSVAQIFIRNPESGCAYFPVFAGIHSPQSN